MGSEIIAAIIEPFMGFGTGLANCVVSMFDAIFKTADGKLTTIASVGFSMMGVGIVVGLGMLVVKKITHRV